MTTCLDCGREGNRGFYPDDDGRIVCSNAQTCRRRIAKASRKANAGRCIDCVGEGVTTARRPAVDRTGAARPGNRCVTHWRAHKRSQSLKSHARRVESTYGLTSEQYWAMYAMQGGRCYGCRKATGKTKRLAVDHDHELAATHDHPVDQACIECVRCLLCGVCNQFIGRNGPDALRRLIEVFEDPPARRWLRAT